MSVYHCHTKIRACIPQRTRQTQTSGPVGSLCGFFFKFFSRAQSLAQSGEFGHSGGLQVVAKPLLWLLYVDSRA